MHSDLDTTRGKKSVCAPDYPVGNSSNAIVASSDECKSRSGGCRVDTRHPSRISRVFGYGYGYSFHVGIQYIWTKMAGNFRREISHELERNI